nr:MAG TPA: hypothetical protein [Herelleviridae sp.]
MFYLLDYYLYFFINRRNGTRKTNKFRKAARFSMT